MGICQSIKKSNQTNTTTSEPVQKKIENKEISPENIKKRRSVARNSLVSMTSQKTKKEGLRRQESSQTVVQRTRLRKSISSFTNILKEEFNINRNISNYEKFVKIKEETGAKVFKARAKNTGKIVCLKEISVNYEDKNFILELKNQEILKSLDHPNIIHYVDSFMSNDEMYFVNEYISNGNLADKINNNYKFTEMHAAVIVYQLLLIISYLNKKNIMHRNIKPENLFLDNFLVEGQFFFVLLSDFKRAKIFNKDTPETELTGTGLYIAPEVIKGNYNEKCDVWTCGIIFYLLLSERTPFKGRTEEETFENIKRKATDYNGFKISSQCKNFLQELIEKDPNKRLSVEEALNHQFFINLNVPSYFSIDVKTIQSILENLKICPFNASKSILLNLIREMKMSQELFERKILFYNILNNNDERIFPDDINNFINMLNIKGNTFSKIQKTVDDFLNNDEIKKKGISMNEFIYFSLTKSMILDNYQTLYWILKEEFNTVTSENMCKVFSESLNDNNLMEKIFSNGQKSIREIEMNKVKEILENYL